MYRMELTVETRLAIPGRETMVCDGEFMYIYSDKAGRKSAVKLKADARTAGDVTALFDSLRGDYDLKVLPEETVNGQPCYVIEGTASKELDHPLVRQMTWFSKDLGLAVRIVVYTKAGEVTGRSDTTDIKPNAPIEDDRFTFEAPEGVQVRDLSQLSNEGGG
jgi:outer membrane lipoprotein-sorting protein